MAEIAEWKERVSSFIEMALITTIEDEFKRVTQGICDTCSEMRLNMQWENPDELIFNLST